MELPTCARINMYILFRMILYKMIQDVEIISRYQLLGPQPQGKSFLDPVQIQWLHALRGRPMRL
jgi:hypothetical protein